MGIAAVVLVSLNLLPPSVDLLKGVAMLPNIVREPLVVVPPMLSLPAELHVDLRMDLAMLPTNAMEPVKLVEPMPNNLWILPATMVPLVLRPVLVRWMDDV